MQIITWSKLWLHGEIIGTFGPDVIANGVTVYYANRIKIARVSNKVVAFDYPQATTVGIYVSREVLEIANLNFYRINGFTEDEQDQLAGQDELQVLYDAGLIAGFKKKSLISGRVQVIGVSSTPDFFTATPLYYYAIPETQIVEQLSRWKAPEAVNDLRGTRNPVFLNVEAPIGLVNRLALEYKMQIKKPEFPGSATYIELDTISGTEDPARVESGITILDGWNPNIDWILDGCLEWSLPERKETMVMQSNRTTMPILYNTKVEQSGVLVAGTQSANKELWVIKAKINEEDFANWPDRIFSEYIGKYGRWLTWQPNHMEIGLKQPVFLSYLVNRKPVPVELTLVCQVFFEQGLTGFDNDWVFEFKQKQSLVSENDVISWAMGYDQLGLDGLRQAQGDRAVTHYTCWLINENMERVSRKRTFYPDYKLREDERNFVFVNSLGGVDSVRLYGGMTQGQSLAGKGAYRSLSAGYTTSDEEYFVRNKSGQLSIRVNTGMLERKWLQYMEELAWSEKIVLETQSGFVALVNEKVSYPKPAKSERIGSRDFEFIKSKESVGFSAMPKSTNNTTDRPTAWVGAQPYCLMDTVSGFFTGMQAFGVLELHYIDVTPSAKVPGVLPKPNLSGNADYVAPINSASCVVGTAPATNARIYRISTKKRNCDLGYKGSGWMIEVVAGAFGGIDVEAANARAEKRFMELDTQENAQLYGTCTLLAAGLTGRYFNYSMAIKDNPTAIFAQTPVATRIDSTVHDSSANLPSGVGPDFFAIEYQGYLKAQVTGNNRYSIEVYNGARLWIEGNLIIDNWTGEGLMVFFVPMVAGRYYEFKLQYHNNGGFKRCWLRGPDESAYFQFVEADELWH